MHILFFMKSQIFLYRSWYSLRMCSLHGYQVTCQIATLFLKFWCLNTLVRYSLSERHTIMSTNISSKKHLQNMAEKAV